MYKGPAVMGIFPACDARRVETSGYDVKIPNFCIISLSEDNLDFFI
jgi:hypothetical protein